MTIRSNLLLLGLCVMVPVLAFAILISVLLIDQDRQAFERGAIERARAMMSAVDAQLWGETNTLEALAPSRALAAGDLALFHEQAVRVLRTQPTWLDIVLALPSGEVVVDANVPQGAALPPLEDSSVVREAVRSRQPVVGPVSRQGPAALMAVPISLPIVRDGAVAYALTVLVRPESFESLIRAQDLPPGWVSGIVDGNGNFVARLPPQPVGTPSSQTFQDAVRRNKEGWYRGLTVEGRDTFSAHARSERNNWSIGLGIPADIVLAGTRRTALLIGMGALAAVAVAFGLAVVIGRRIVRPMVSLAALARTVGKEGAAMPVPHATVREVDDVALALKDADSAVRERQVLIQREKDALQASDRAKDQFIAMLSHELRNPLAALTSAASILQRRDVPADAAKEARQIIDRQLKHMSRMIEDLLDVSRVVVGKANLSIESLDLAELVSTVVAAWQLRQAASAQSIDVQTQSVHVRADRTRMEQIVSNLLDNAMKFSSPGNTIRVTVAPRDGAALLTVSDEGRGIAPTMLDRVFDIFVQEDQGLGRSPGGLGLGLALVKRLVELQGGRVSAVSNGIGRGSIFSVELPRAQPEQSTASRITPTEQPVRHVKRILVIDDNEDARQALCTLLELEGHRTYQAPDGGRGVDLARGARPDVALIDIGLPDIDGYEVARRIKAGSETGITLIALTGYGQTEDKNRALAAGFDAHLVKPISIDRLSEVLTAH